MTVKFKSQATGDLVMVSTHAQEVLDIIGKNAGEPGVLVPEDMPSALAKLKALPDAAHDHRNEDQDDDAAKKAPFVDEFVSLRQRAWPLVRMIEEAQAAGAPIVWNV